MRREARADPLLERERTARLCEEGLRATGCAARGAEIVGIQEVRARREQLPEQRAAPRTDGTSTSSRRSGRATAASASTPAEPGPLDTTSASTASTTRGGCSSRASGASSLANVYFPNGSGKDRDNSRVPYKLDFYRALFERVQRLRRGGYRVLVMGDFNTAHREIDLARPKENRETSGFLPEERAEIDRWLEAGWIDTFRRFEPGPGHYSWWSQRFGVRERNVGWRIDYVLASPAAMKLRAPTPSSSPR